MNLAKQVHPKYNMIIKFFSLKQQKENKQHSNPKFKPNDTQIQSSSKKDKNLRRIGKNKEKS